jgi:hypothetical protein
LFFVGVKVWIFLRIDERLNGAFWMVKIEGEVFMRWKNRQGDLLMRDDFKGRWFSCGWRLMDSWEKIVQD